MTSCCACKLTRVCVQTPPSQRAGAGLDQQNERVCRLPWLGHVYSVPPPLIFPLYSEPPSDNGEETTGELHSEGECQSGAASLQSIPLETGAPHPSLLNISLLQLTPGERGEMQPRMRVLPWERRPPPLLLASL